MATTRLSDTMIRTLLDALRCRDSEGRYEIFQAPRRTLDSLATRGKVETLEIASVRDSATGRPVRTCHRTYLTEEAVAYLREALEYVLNQRGEDRDAVWQDWLTAERRNQWAVIDFFGLTADAYEVVTTAPHERGTHRETLGRADAWEQMGNAMTNGQRITLHDGAMTVHTKLGAAWTFKPQRPCPGCGAAPGEPCRDALLDLIAAPESRPAAEVLAADPIPADTSVRDGMPGEQIAREGLRSPRDVMAAEAYVVQVRSERVWQLPNHDDGAHMSRGDVAWSLRRMMDRNPEQTRASVDTDGTVYLSNGWQACRYVPVNLFADYSADRCPGCGTPYAVNGDGPCEGGRSPLAPGSRDYDAEAAALLGDGERWVRHWFNKGELSAVNGMDRREALATVVLGLKRGEVHPADEGGVRVEHDGGSSAYWLEPVTVQPNPAAAEERPSVDPDEIRAQVVAEAEGKPCRGCGAPAGESCEPMGMCEEAREEVVAARVDEAANLGARFLPQDPAEEGTRPCLELGTGEVVTVYREGGRLVVSVDLSGLPADGDPLPMVITVGERDVFVADEEHDTARDVRQVVEEFKDKEREDYEEQERQGEDVDGHPFEALERLGALRY